MLLAKASFDVEFVLISYPLLQTEGNASTQFRIIQVGTGKLAGSSDSATQSDAVPSLVAITRTKKNGSTQYISCGTNYPLQTAQLQRSNLNEGGRSLCRVLL